MRTFRLSLMILLSMLMLSVASSSVWAHCTSTNKGVLAWWPKFWEDKSCGCTYDAMVTKIYQGAANVGATGLVYYQPVLDNSPPSLTTLAKAVSSTAPCS